MTRSPLPHSARTLLLGFLLLSLAVAPAGALDDLEKQVTEARQRVVEAYAGRDVDAFLALYTSDAVLMRMTGDFVKGRDGLREYFESGQVPRDLAFESRLVERIGDLVLDIGLMTGRLPEQAGGHGFNAEYLVLARPEDGELKIHRTFVFPSRVPPASTSK